MKQKNTPIKKKKKVRGQTPKKKKKKVEGQIIKYLSRDIKRSSDQGLDLCLEFVSEIKMKNTTSFRLPKGVTKKGVDITISKFESAHIGKTGNDILGTGRSNDRNEGLRIDCQGETRYVY